MLMVRSISSAQTEKPIKFRVDRPLVKLVKWLRLLGYDTVSSRLPDKRHNANASGPDDRIWITKAKLTAPGERIMQVSTNNPIDQLRQVITALRLPRQSLKPFTRCSECNNELVRIEREKLRGQVPDYVWETHRQFQTCKVCRKIFWPGSHVDKQRQVIDQLFE